MSGRNIRPLISCPFRAFPRVGHGVGQAVAPHFDPHFFQHFYSKKAPKTEVSDAFWSCWADSNRRPHPYQVIKCSPAAAVQGFAGVFAAKRMRSKTLCSMCSVRSFPCVGHGVGQSHRHRRCGLACDGVRIVMFCTAGSSKRTPWKKHRATSGELRSRRAALNFYGKFPVWVKMWVKAFSAHQETAAEHRR